MDRVCDIQISNVTNSHVLLLTVPLTFKKVPMIHAPKTLILVIKERKTEKSKTESLKSPPAKPLYQPRVSQ